MVLCLHLNYDYENSFKQLLDNQTCNERKRMSPGAQLDFIYLFFLGGGAALIWFINVTEIFNTIDLHERMS